MVSDTSTRRHPKNRSMHDARERNRWGLVGRISPPVPRAWVEEYLGRDTSEKAAKSFETPRRKDLKLVAVWTL